MDKGGSPEKRKLTDKEGSPKERKSSSSPEFSLIWPDSDVEVAPQTSGDIVKPPTSARFVDQFNLL